MGSFMESMIRIEQRDYYVHVEQSAHPYTPSWSSNCWTCSSVITSPREGSSGTPPRERGGFWILAAACASPRRASLDITCPAVHRSRRANSLAACKTSSSISNVVLTHLMLMHQSISVNAPPPNKTASP